MPIEIDLPDVSRGFHVFRDGDSWCAVGPTFRDLQQDRAGFGDTAELAVDAWWAANADDRGFRSVVHIRPRFESFKVHQ